MLEFLAIMVTWLTCDLRGSVWHPLLLSDMVFLQSDGKAGPLPLSEGASRSANMTV